MSEDVVVKDSDLGAMSLEQLQVLASRVGVGMYGLDEKQLRDKLVLEGTK